MIVVLKENVSNSNVKELIQRFKELNLDVNLSKGEHKTILGLIGDTSRIDLEFVKSFSGVENVQRVGEPYKKANRKFHEEDSVIDMDGTKIGGGNFCVMAGPCSIESEEQIIEVAKSVKESGATMLRGGAFKPRTSPYAFQGLKGDGIKLLVEAKKVTGLKVVTEIMNINHLDLFNDIDVIQVGARNMQNFEMLKELGHCNKPILLKRGMSSTIEELLMSAEYIMSGGNNNVILCERGIRTFETATRNTLDISAVPVLKAKTHLPVIVDPSHASGVRTLVKPLALASVACGADGLIIEAHNNPEKALCDGAQSLTLDGFKGTMDEIKALVNFFKKRI